MYIAHNLLKNICSRFTQKVITDEKNSDEILCMLKETYKVLWWYWSVKCTVHLNDELRVLAAD